MRPANKTDSDMLFAWRNDPDTRKASFNIDPVDWDVHCKWFDKALSNDQCKIFIESSIDKKIGVVRFDKINDDVSEINITINPKLRGQGWGKLLAKCSLCDTSIILARIKKQNHASIAIFKHAEFIHLFSYDEVKVFIKVRGEK